MAVEACAKWEGGSVVEIAVGTLSVHKKKGGEKGTTAVIMDCRSNLLFVPNLS